MRIALPKAMRGYGYDRLAPFEMNDFDVERLLPSLFYAVVTRGRRGGKKVNDPKAIDRYVEALASHPRVRGFDDHRHRRLLERWVRSSIVRVGRTGQGGRGREQIEFVLPLTLLAYKPGFPAETSRQRRVHLFLYRDLLGVLHAIEAKPSPQSALSAIFTDVFGKGLTIGAAPKYDGTYDGAADLDVHTLLAIFFLDGLTAREALKGTEELPRYTGALPVPAAALGWDLLLYLLAYRERISAGALTRGLMSLINFELFVYTAKMLYAANLLVDSGKGPLAMRKEGGASPPEIYVDFTRVRNGESDELARACVERDLEELRTFFDSLMRFRTLDRYVQLQFDLKSRLGTTETPAYLEALLATAADQRIQGHAGAEFEAIRYETLEGPASDEEKKEAETFFDDVLRRNQGSLVDAVVQVLADAQRKNALT